MFITDKEFDAAYKEFKDFQKGFLWCKYNERDAFKVAIRNLIKKVGSKSYEEFEADLNAEIDKALEEM